MGVARRDGGKGTDGATRVESSERAVGNSACGLMTTQAPAPFARSLARFRSIFDPSRFARSPCRRRYRRLVDPHHPLCVSLSLPPPPCVELPARTYACTQRTHGRARGCLSQFTQRTAREEFFCALCIFERMRRKVGIIV